MAEDTTDERTDGADEREGIESGPGEPTTERTTAPQSAYTGRDVAVGFVVATLGVAITFGVPLLFL